MSKKNVAHSVRTRLLNLSRQKGEDFQLLFNRYAVERLLFRLAQSVHQKSFVLKGAMLFALWTGDMHRPTRDLDLLGFGDAGEERLRGVFQSLCTLPVEDDGLVFDPAAVSVEPIREDQEYGGQRVRLKVTLDKARLDLQVDVGFGDAITPAAEVVEYPTLLGMEAPTLRAYPKETVVAEKLEAMVKLGLANSRMKDFFDLVVLARTFPFDGGKLCEAITATFERRGTALPADSPVALTAVFAAADSKLKRWKAFRTRNELEERVGELALVVEELSAFLLPPLGAAAEGEAFGASWGAGGPWL